MEKRGEWEKFKLVEVLNNPLFFGKLARLGNDIFELKGVRTGNFESIKRLESSTLDAITFAFALRT
jgi:hypothetical protein